MMFRVIFFLFGLFAFGDSQFCTVEDYSLIDGSCFKGFYYFRTTWEKAQQICELDGANLATINSCSLLGDLATYFHSGFEASDGYWIGASDSIEEGKWVWRDGSEVPLGVGFWGTTGIEWTPEPSGNDGENCAILSPTDQYYFHDEICTNYGNPLCQMDPEITTEFPDS